MMGIKLIIVVLISTHLYIYNYGPQGDAVLPIYEGTSTFYLY